MRFFWGLVLFVYQVLGAATGVFAASASIQSVEGEGFAVELQATQQKELLTGVPMIWSMDVFKPGQVVTELSDGDSQNFVFPDAAKDNRNVVWVTLDETYDVVNHYFVGNRTSGMFIRYYDEQGKLISSYSCPCHGDTSVFVPNVRTIAFVSLYKGLENFVSDVKVWGTYVPQPENVQFLVSDVSHDRVTLKFSAKAGTYSQFRLYQGEKLLGTFTSPGSHQVVGLQSETSYTFRLEVWNEGKKETRFETVTTLKAPVELQTPIVDYEVSSDRVSFRIVAVGADEVVLYRDGVLLRTFTSGSVVFSYLDLGLSEETEYVYRVVARNDLGQEKMVEKTVRTLPKPPPPNYTPFPVPEVSPTPVPPVDTGNEDFDDLVGTIAGAGEMLKIGGMTIIFWAILIGVIIFGAFWLWLLWRSWMGRAFGTGAGSSGGSGTGSGSRAYRYVKQVKLGGKGRSSVVGTGSVRLGGRASRVSRVSRSKTSRSSGVEVFEHQGKVYEVNMVHWDPAKVKKPAASYLNKFQ